MLKMALNIIFVLGGSKCVETDSGYFDYLFMKLTTQNEDTHNR